MAKIEQRGIKFVVIPSHLPADYIIPFNPTDLREDGSPKVLPAPPPIEYGSYDTLAEAEEALRLVQFKSIHGKVWMAQTKG